MNNKLVSIIIPVYNVELLIKDCLESVLNQTYKNIEIILIDDGSKDKSGLICDEYAKKDDRIIVIHKNNEGVSVARNIGIDKSKGDYICFIDSDDYISKYMVEHMLKKIEEEDSDIVVCNFVEEKNNKIIKKYYVDKDMIDTKKNFMRYIAFKCTWQCMIWNKMYKKTAIGDIRFKAGTKIAEDYLFLMEVLDRNVKKISYIDEVLYYYVRWDLSTLYTINIYDKYESIGAYIKISNILKQNGIEEYVLLQNKIICQYIIYSSILGKKDEKLEQFCKSCKKQILKSKKIKLIDKLKYILAVYFRKLYFFLVKGKYQNFDPYMK